MPFPHQHLAQKISDQLNVLAAQLKTRTRASQNDANHWLESVMARFFNALFGWELVNLNADQPNFPAADLGDRSRRIAMQITNQDAASKITETAKKAEVHQLGEAFDRLILFFLLPEKPSMPRSFVQPPAGPSIECWDITDLLKRMPELQDQSCLSAAEAVLERELVHQSASKEPPPSNLPGGYIGQTFVGREQFLKDLRASLLKQTHATAITQRPAATVTEGLGGLGKTHVAVEYADRHRHEYTALLFVSGDTPQRLQTSLAALCDVPGLHLNDNLPLEEAARASIALHWLATHSGWLLIVDNVDDEAGALALKEHFEHLRNGHVLITSRLHHWSNNVDPLDLSVLSQEDAIDLLLQLTDKHRRKAADDEAKVRTLAELMDGLPLALHQAAGYIIEECCTFAEYLTIYKDKAVELLNWSNDVIIPYERPDKSVPRPVLITWKTSFEKLSEEACFWLLVFSHFSPEPIPEFLLDDEPDANDHVKARHRAAHIAIAQADKFNLLTRYSDPSRFKIHRLVQDVTRLGARAEDRTAALAMGIQLMEENYPGDPDEVSTWAQWTLLQPHALAVCNYAPDASGLEGLTWLLAELSILLQAKALYAQAEPLILRALKIDENRLDSGHPDIGIQLNSLATLFMKTNRLAQAEPLLRRALQISETRFGLNHPKVAMRLNNLAQVLQDTNQLAEAESLMRRALQIDEASLDPNHPEIGVRLNNIAHLLQATNRMAEAEPLMHRALHISESRYGSNHPMVARHLNNLGLLYQATNRIAEAEPLLRRNLQIIESSFGPDHPDVAIALNNLATIFLETDRLAEAEPLLQRALNIDEACHGPMHPSVASRLNNLAVLFKDTNRLAEVEPLLRRALQIDEASYGMSHPDVARDLNNLALFYLETNRLAEAEQLMYRSLHIEETSHGLDHPNLARNLNNLALLLKAMNRTAEAEPLIRRSLQIIEASYGLAHPLVATNLNNLAQILQAMNQLDEAETLMRRALQIDEACVGPNHPKIAIRLNNLALLLQDTNRKGEAEPLMCRALKINEDSFGPEHTNVAVHLNNFSQLLKETNRKEQAESMLRRALRIFVSSLGLEHPKTQGVICNYLDLLQALKLPEAEIKQRVIAAMRGE